MADHTIRVTPGLQFMDCQPRPDQRTGGRDRPGGAAGEGCEKQHPGGGPQAPQPGLALPRSPRRGRRGREGSGGEPSAPGRSNGAAISRTQAQAARPTRTQPDRATASPRRRGRAADKRGPRRGKRRPQAAGGPREEPPGPKPRSGPAAAPHGPTRCTRAKPKHSKGDRTGSPQRRDLLLYKIYLFHSHLYIFLFLIIFLRFFL